MTKINCESRVMSDFSFIFLIFEMSSWKSDILAVAEPGEIASEFLQNVIGSMRLGSFGRRPARLSHFSNLSDLVARFPRFIMGGTLYRFMGRHTQVFFFSFLNPQLQTVEDRIQVLCTWSHTLRMQLLYDNGYSRFQCFSPL